ncbi:Receptor-likey region [Durusdinium trenchii]|uniref:Transmembrane domain-and RING domain-containing protein 6 n=1 Tax=Durusdinium trenchii TaxID=1381693 RepID=A0ABP0S4Y4_9DINO
MAAGDLVFDHVGPEPNPNPRRTRSRKVEPDEAVQVGAQSPNGLESPHGLADSSHDAMLRSNRLGDASTPSVTISFGCVRNMARGDNRQEQLKCHIYMKSFLRKNGFRGVNMARAGGCFSRRESIYPIQLAAQMGDIELVKILLAAGADVEKESSRGRTALDFAQEANLHGSHENMLLLLRGQLRRCNLRNLQFELLE